MSGKERHQITSDTVYMTFLPLSLICCQISTHMCTWHSSTQSTTFYVQELSSLAIDYIIITERKQDCSQAACTIVCTIKE